MSKEVQQFLEMIRVAASNNYRLLYCWVCGKDTSHTSEQVGNQEYFACSECGNVTAYTTK